MIIAFLCSAIVAGLLSLTLAVMLELGLGLALLSYVAGGLAGSLLFVRLAALRSAPGRM